jgi:NADH-ubiquinone oxidoreductase chain 5
LGLLAACGTAFYSCRLLLLVFIINTNLYKSVFQRLHESSFILLLPLFILSLFSIFFGYIMREIFVGIGTNFYGASLYIRPSRFVGLDYEFLPLYIKLLPFVLSICSAILAYLLYCLFSYTKLYNYLFTTNFYILYRFLSKK